jgi:hypothetical protein
VITGNMPNIIFFIIFLSVGRLRQPWFCASLAVIEPKHTLGGDKTQMGKIATNRLDAQSPAG